MALREREGLLTCCPRSPGACPARQSQHDSFPWVCGFHLTVAALRGSRPTVYLPSSSPQFCFLRGVVAFFFGLVLYLSARRGASLHVSGLSGVGPFAVTLGPSLEPSSLFPLTCWHPGLPYPLGFRPFPPPSSGPCSSSSSREACLPWLPY